MHGILQIDEGKLLNGIQWPQYCFGDLDYNLGEGSEYVLEQEKTRVVIYYFRGLYGHDSSLCQDHLCKSRLWVPRIESHNAGHVKK